MGKSLLFNNSTWPSAKGKAWLKLENKKKLQNSRGSEVETLFIGSACLRHEWVGIPLLVWGTLIILFSTDWCWCNREWPKKIKKSRVNPKMFLEMEEKFHYI